MPDTDDFKVHRFYSNIVRNMRCSAGVCEWPPHRGVVNHTIADAMEHSGTTGHPVKFSVTDQYELMPSEEPVIAPTVSQVAQSRNLDVDDDSNASVIDDELQRQHWTQQMEQLLLHNNIEHAREEASEILLEIAQAAHLEALVQTCREVMRHPRSEGRPAAG